MYLHKLALRISSQVLPPVRCGYYFPHEQPFVYLSNIHTMNEDEILLATLSSIALLMAIMAVTLVATS